MKIAEILEIADEYSTGEIGDMATFRANHSAMESKLRTIQKLMPEIKVAIQDAYSYRANAISKKGKKWAAEYDALLKQLEGWENEYFRETKR